MNRSLTFLLLAILVFVSCKHNKDVKLDANQIVNKAIEASGGLVLENSEICFDFREKHYRAIRTNGSFKLERHFKDSLYSIRDVLSNSGFKRFVDDKFIQIPDSLGAKYANSVNSVHYFSVLPYGLNDAAVNKSYLGLVELKDRLYHKIKVTFDEEGGGQDFEDVFIYWIDTEDFKVEYLAYSFHVNGGGMRFREAFNERKINGIRFVDYNNFKPIQEKIELEDLDRAFEMNNLKLLSKIQLKNISVNIIN